MMKKSLLFLLVAVFTCNMAYSQITIDRDKSDWADIPILSEPGVFPYAKVFVDDTHVYYMLEVEDADGERIGTDKSNYFVSMIDADNSKDTGDNHWVYPYSGLDYQISNTFHFWNGSSMVWKWHSIDTAATSTFAEARFEIAKMLTIKDQPEEAKIPLAETFGLGLRYNKEGTDTYHPLNNWDFAERKVFTVKPRPTFVFNNLSDVTLRSQDAYYMPFMKDTDINDYLDFQSGGYSTQNPQHWASWSIDLVDPGKYHVLMTHQNADAGKIKFELVNVATNAVAFETTEDIWYAKHVDGFEEQHIKELDFSTVPAGKYMLKITNPTTWGAYLKVKELVVYNDLTTAVASNKLAASHLRISTKENTLSVASEIPGILSVFAVDGREVGLQAVAKNETYRLPLTAGVYIVKINTDLGTISRKVVVN